MSRLWITLIVGALLSYGIRAGLVIAESPQPTESRPLRPLPKFLRSPKLADRYLSTRDIHEVLEFERTEPVCEQLLKRPGVDSEHRLEALVKLAEIQRTDTVALLVARIQRPEEQPAERIDAAAAVQDDLARLLPRLESAQLAKHRAQILSLAEGERAGIVRQSALVALAAADQSSQAAWDIAARSDEQRLDLLLGLPELRDDALRAEFFPRVLPLIANDAPDEIQVAAIQAIVHLKGELAPVFVTLCELVARSKHVDACVDTLRQIPPSAWSADRIQPLIDHLIDHAGKQSLAERSLPRSQRLLAFVGTMAEQLPADRRAEVLATTRRLTVQSVEIRALPEKMAYDVTVLIAEAGRPVQIVFRNEDIMPHNLVIGSEPAARVELGLLADEMQTDPDALAKGYVPDSEKRLFATKLIQTGQADTIEFIIPDVGVLPFVCTFPGHWSKMYGALKIVDDRDAYITAHQPLPSADALLGIRTVAWKYEELADELNQLEHGRSFASGERWFRQASCWSCHRMRGQGGTVGPELSEIKKKYMRSADVLLHVMEPSRAIDDAYAAVTVQDANGKVHQGIVLRRTPEELFLQPNPLGKCEPTIIRVEDIESEAKSKVSSMPEKLLNVIVTKSEVYDLLAYVISGGNSADPMFHTGEPE
jgi:putative heme-binding domain-containing protein